MPGARARWLERGMTANGHRLLFWVQEKWPETSRGPGHTVPDTYEQPMRWVNFISRELGSWVFVSVVKEFLSSRSATKGKFLLSSHTGPYLQVPQESCVAIIQKSDSNSIGVFQQT